MAEILGFATDVQRLIAAARAASDYLADHGHGPDSTVRREIAEAVAELEARIAEIDRQAWEQGAAKGQADAA